MHARLRYARAVDMRTRGGKEWAPEVAAQLGIDERSRKIFIRSIKRG